jgi:4-hydroxybenzoate polyprenyltransferase
MHALHLYGSAGIAAFGWAVCRLLDWDARPWLPLWFAAGLLVYNIDRLRHDPADEVNTPERLAASQRLRRWGLAVAALSAGVLLFVPLLRRDWITLALAAGGTLICLHYSLPFRGRRWKDLPLLKTFFAPGIVAAAIFGLPLMHGTWRTFSVETALVGAWATSRLLANMILCDLRDLAGDEARGVVSLPHTLGPRGTEALLWALTAFSGGVAFGLAFTADPRWRIAWITLGAIGALYLGVLIAAVRRPRSERFYERWVEGLLLLPALIVLVCSHPAS